MQVVCERCGVAVEMAKDVAHARIAEKKSLCQRCGGALMFPQAEVAPTVTPLRAGSTPGTWVFLEPRALMMDVDEKTAARQQRDERATVRRWWAASVMKAITTLAIALSFAVYAAHAVSRVPASYVGGLPATMKYSLATSALAGACTFVLMLVFIARYRESTRVMGILGTFSVGLLAVLALKQTTTPDSRGTPSPTGAVGPSPSTSSAAASPAQATVHSGTSASLSSSPPAEPSVALVDLVPSGAPAPGVDAELQSAEQARIAMVTFAARMLATSSTFMDVDTAFAILRLVEGAVPVDPAASSGQGQKDRANGIGTSHATAVAQVLRDEVRAAMSDTPTMPNAQRTAIDQKLSLPAANYGALLTAMALAYGPTRARARWKDMVQSGLDALRTAMPSDVRALPTEAVAYAKGGDVHPLLAGFVDETSTDMARDIVGTRGLDTDHLMRRLALEVVRGAESDIVTSCAPLLAGMSSSEQGFRLMTEIVLHADKPMVRCDRDWRRFQVALRVASESGEDGVPSPKSRFTSMRTGEDRTRSALTLFGETTGQLFYSLGAQLGALAKELPLERRRSMVVAAIEAAKGRHSSRVALGEEGAFFGPHALPGAHGLLAKHGIGNDVDRAREGEMQSAAFEWMLTAGIAPDEVELARALEAHRAGFVSDGYGYTNRGPLIVAVRSAAGKKALREVLAKNPNWRIEKRDLLADVQMPQAVLPSTGRPSACLLRVVRDLERFVSAREQALAKDEREQREKRYADWRTRLSTSLNDEVKRLNDRSAARFAPLAKRQERLMKKREEDMSERERAAARVERDAIRAEADALRDELDALRVLEDARCADVFPSMKRELAMQYRRAGYRGLSTQGLFSDIGVVVGKEVSKREAGRFATHVEDFVRTSGRL